MFNRAFWRDVRFLQFIGQVFFILVFALAAGFLYSNVSKNINRLGLTVGYGFLRNPASFDIGESYIPFQPSDSYGQAIWVGIVNTLMVSVFGIIFATIVGVLAGIARLSSNWLVNKLAGAYIGVIRNTPLVIQLMFWYFGIVLQMPNVRDALVLPGPVYLTNRGLYLTWLEPTETFKTWQFYIYAAVVSIVVVYLVIKWVGKKAGHSPALFWYSAYLLLPLLILGVGAVLQPSSPVAVNRPQLSGLNFQGGVRLTPEFAALLSGLVLYTGAFIAEVVRAGIQSVSLGQVEAARSLGFTNGQTLHLVVFPQALRVIIPPMTSQYLNLAKNSSLAIAIGFPDLFSIAGTVFNQTGAAVEIIVIMMLSYLSMSLFTSLLMNIYNNRVRLVER